MLGHLHAILREVNEPEVVPVVLGSLGKVLTSASSVAAPDMCAFVGNETPLTAVRRAVREVPHPPTQSEFLKIQLKSGGRYFIASYLW